MTERNFNEIESSLGVDNIRHIIKKYCEDKLGILVNYWHWGDYKVYQKNDNLLTIRIEDGILVIVYFYKYVRKYITPDEFFALLNSHYRKWKIDQI